MELKPEDLKIDTFRPSPQGWILKADICVRITHIPTGISVEKCDDRSQHKNKAEAYTQLCEAVAKYYRLASVHDVRLADGLADPLGAAVRVPARISNGNAPEALGSVAPVQLKLYACNNRPRPTAEARYPVQDGWTYSEKDGKHTREPIIVFIKHEMSVDCRYDAPLTDVGCMGCRYQRKNE